ncbi:MarR family winged helix-turn-helix transcriptional regulator [Yoonia sp. I 8.24]|uniref:MarR family winged helix-turn-helix transcriptional regulator n=1 Tax=Yoonia sp. I 8.24 TaxID=1537229 RepID=UPI001EE07008|nr:MarR family transcriptional regulator [Yoonia sp. I 8.24]MCG3267296.1 MarR family transcriptional regulator [Yoonia sp. I 8.24]
MQIVKQGARFHLLMHSTHLLEDRLRVLLKPLGLHAGQARFIHALGRIGEASQRQLSSEFNITPASMSQMTKRLINNGYIQLRRDPKDKRTAILSLTEKGEQLLDEVVAIWQEVDQIVVDAIGAENADQLFAQSGNLRDALGGRAPMVNPNPSPKRQITRVAHLHRSGNL